VSKKNVPLCRFLYLREILIDFQKFFIAKNIVIQFFIVNNIYHKVVWHSMWWGI